MYTKVKAFLVGEPLFANHRYDMKNTIIAVIVIAVLGVLGYFFYNSLQDLGNEETNFDFQPAEIVTDEFDDIEILGDSDLFLDSEIDGLAELDFEESITEENIEEVIANTEQEEENLDTSFDELESLDF